jgi:hypothetical protein
MKNVPPKHTSSRTRQGVLTHSSRLNNLLLWFCTEPVLSIIWLKLQWKIQRTKRIQLVHHPQITNLQPRVQLLQNIPTYNCLK